MCIFWVILRKNWIFFILLLLVVVGCSSSSNSSDACSNIFGRIQRNDFFLILFENGVLRWRVYFCRYWRDGKTLRSFARSRVLYCVSDGFLQYTAVVNKWRKIYKRQIAHGNESISPFILYPLSILLLFGVECISRERERERGLFFLENSFSPPSFKGDLLFRLFSCLYIVNPLVFIDLVPAAAAGLKVRGGSSRRRRKGVQFLAIH